ncbi:cell division topological specificity factor MinE [Anaerosalibacter massiliensis]|uniref:Cell division topological specificity factor n=1 Tax=Anaerosalibacter massiliensis TaxID=1347392 RepID=A0A9X2MJ50_9FIRM|nr:cell division topological specificity factor MinE [Anaerosalibacter massiliensis]MCR2045003.1 cell division topological specificity factor MinE [Anaerosalibacter massiliensis]
MDFFKMFSKENKESKNIAKERLKLVLIHDRADISPKFLQMIESDIIRVMSEYVEIDEEGLDVKMTRTKNGNDGSSVPALIANIPIIKVKDM